MPGVPRKLEGSRLKGPLRGPKDKNNVNVRAMRASLPLASPLKNSISSQDKDTKGLHSKPSHDGK